MIPITLRSKLPSIVLWTMLAVLSISNLLLIRQNLQMRAALNKSNQTFLQPGDRVPPFSATGPHNELVGVQYPGTGPKRVLLFFTPTCRFCHEQFANWRELLASADRQRFEVLGVVGDTVAKANVADYLREVNCASDAATPLPVGFITEAVRRDYKLSATPITLVVANDGRIEKAWVGRWNATVLAEAQSFFNVNFSGSGPKPEHAALR